MELTIKVITPFGDVTEQITFELPEYITDYFSNKSWCRYKMLVETDDNQSAILEDKNET